MEAPGFDVLGVRVSAINLQQAVALLETRIDAQRRGYVCVTGVHGVMESRRCSQLQQIHNQAALVTPDGMPMVWLGKRAGHRHMTRVYGPDLMLAMMQRSVAKGWRHFFYGGGPGVADLLADRLQARFEGLRVAGTCCPPFRELTEHEDRDIVEQINRSCADVVWVGLGTPRQERWMAAHLGRLAAPVMLGVGAAFDFHAGLKKQAPRWMQQSGLEWLFRLGAEPRRLWKRYLRINPAFVAALLAESLRPSRSTIQPPTER